MPRIDPAYPPLWRSASVLQFGLPAVASLEHPLPWQLRLIRALETGVAEDALETQAVLSEIPPGGVEQLLSAIAPALTAYRTFRPRVRLIAAPEVTREQRETTVDALRADGFEVVEHDPGATPAIHDDIAVILTCHIVDPRLVAAHMADDVTHIPIALKGSAATVGPLVRPGLTACLMCVALHERDADPDWPLLAAQLTARGAQNTEPGVVREAAGAAGRLILAQAHPPSTGSILSVRADSLIREWNAYPPHADCRCRSLAGSEKVAALVDLGPTSAPGFAMRA